MTDNSINSIGSTSAVSSKSSSSASKISAETKAKLQALGLDPTKYTTEAQAQAAIAQAQQGVQQTGQAGGGGNKEEMEAIKSDAQSLAAQVGASYDSNAKVPDIMAAISDKINSLQAEAGDDPVKLQQVKADEDQFETISNSISTMETQKQTAQAQLNGSMDGLARYNKVGLNLQ